MPESPLTREDILSAIVGQFFDDLDFIEKLNDLTYSRKVQLKNKAKKT